MWQISPGGNGLLPELEQFGKKECKKVHLLNTYANVGFIVYIIFDFHFLFLLFSVSDLTSAHSVLSSPTYISSLPHFMSCTNKCRINKIFPEQIITVSFFLSLNPPGLEWCGRGQCYWTDKDLDPLQLHRMSATATLKWGEMKEPANPWTYTMSSVFYMALT